MKLTKSVDRLGERLEIRVKDEHFSRRNWKDGVTAPEMGSLGEASFRDSSGVQFWARWLGLPLSSSGGDV